MTSLSWATPHSFPMPLGLLKNRMWGLVLSVINCVITITLMMFLLPAGIMDGIFAGSALILILMQYFGDKKIEE